MNLFLELHESDLWFWTIENYINPYRLRKAARALVFNDENKIALMYMVKDSYHTLPSGWVEVWENIQEWLVREIREEVGADIIILEEIGITIEYRNFSKLMQISYCYMTKVFWELYATNLDEFEKEGWFTLLLVSLDEAIEYLKKDNNKNLFTKFIQKRDLSILTEWKKILENIA